MPVSRDIDQSGHKRPHPKLLQAIRLKRQIAQKFREAGQHKLACKLDDCTETESLVCCSDCGNRWWVKTHCHLRICPICSRQKAIERSQYLMAIANQQKQCKMITLTMRRWTQDPREGIKYLRGALTRFRHLQIMSKCTGGAYTIEVIPKDDGWHIHAHLIVDVPYIPIKVLWSSWARCVRQPYAHVRIQSATKANVKNYICKYASKAALKDIGLDRIVEWYEAVKGSRLWGTFGAWYNAKLEDMVPDDDQKPETYACPFCGGIGTTFHARAGPWIIGDGWQLFCPPETSENRYVRDNKELLSYL